MHIKFYKKEKRSIKRRRACNNPRNYALKSLSAELLQRNTFRAAECASMANARILAERQVIQLSAILTNFFFSPPSSPFLISLRVP